MIKREIKIQLDSGLEARPIALLVQVASQYDSLIHLEAEGRKVNAKSIMGMMTLGLPSGENVIVEVDGQDEVAAIKSIEEYLSGQSKQN
ncbi:MAG: HPr family phosphocarrier protein [Lachnospiraceae bacterium]